MNIKAVLFDAYGTLLYIGHPLQPYRQLLRHIQAQGQEMPQNLLTDIMTRPLPLLTVAHYYELEPDQIHALDMALQTELGSIRLYPESLQAVQDLQAAGYKVGVCSNLAWQYEQPIQQLLPMLDAYLFSFELGLTKPHPELYQAACMALGCAPEEVLMVGDSYSNDVVGPRSAGLQACWLRRAGQRSLVNHEPHLTQVTEVLALLQAHAPLTQ